ncbi:MAG: hypothetical protein ACI8R1_002299 [Psychrobacter glaciei]|jgi:hypothetical protein
MRPTIYYNDNHSTIEKIVKGSNEYETYWHIYNYRMSYEGFKDPVPREPKFYKDILIELLENSGKSKREIEALLKNTPRILTPFQYVGWFYKDDRISLWLKIVCNRFTNIIPPVNNKSDIEKFVHDLIYNANIAIRNNVIFFINPVFKQRKLDSIESFKRLEKIYSTSKIDKRSVAFLRDSKNVEHAYNYIKDKIPTVLVLKYAQDISFESTSDKLNYVLAVLDYWNFEKLWGRNNLAQLNGEDDEQTREEFIKKIKDACNSKNSRDRAKKIKKTGLDLTKQNKENLRYLAKSRGKTQRDVLNELVESAYNQTRNQEIQLNSSFLNQDAFFDSIPQTQPSSSQSENNEEKLIPNQTSRIEDKEERSRLYDTDSAISSIYDNEKLPTGTPTPKQEARSLQTFLPEENYGKQIKDAGTVNTDSYHKL